MNKSKVLKAAVISLALLFAVTGVAYADNNISKFTDIDGHWAEQHIINVYNKGLMDGVNETEFKPGDYVRNYDALVSISRMLVREKDINLEQLVEKYKENVLDKYSVPEDAREGLAICLEKGLITDYDVSAFKDTPYATKKDVAKYLGLAFGVKVDKDAPPVVLAFKDSMYIPTLYKPYVKFLIDKGVVNSTGEFRPNDPLDRAAFAKMLDISSSVYDEERFGKPVSGTTPDEVDPGMPDSSGGQEAQFPEGGNYDDPVVVEVGEQPGIVAYVDEVIPEYGNLAVFVGTERRVYKVAEDAVCTIDEVPSGYWKLKKTDMVRLYVENGEVVKIIGESKLRKVVGKLVDIQTGSKTVLTIKTAAGETRSYTITANTIVIKDGRKALWQELKSGNDLVLTTSYDELIEINADGVKSTDKGVIESIVYSRMAPPKLVITALDGKQNSYFAGKSIEISGAANDIYALRPGMQVEANLIDDEIVKIGVVNEPSVVQAELKGVIKNIDAGSRLIVVETFDSSVNNYTDKNIYITESTNIVYIDLNTLDINTLDLNSLKVGQTISVVGTGSPEGIYAKTIQLMN